MTGAVAIAETVADAMRKVIGCNEVEGGQGLRDLVSALRGLCRELRDRGFDTSDLWEAISVLRECVPPTSGEASP